MKKIVKIGVSARDELAKGAKALSEAVSRTLGPFGCNFFLEKNKRPTNDGVSIAREFQGENEIQNLGVDAVREPATKIVDEVGDGTTSAILFTYSLYQTLSRFLGKEGVAGKKPSELRRQLLKEKEEVLDKLKEATEPIETKEQLVKSAIVSVEDEEMGQLIGEAQWTLGKDGYLLAEQTNDRTSSVEMVKGIRIDNGFGTSQLINNVAKQTLELDNVSVILTSYTIKDFKSLEGFINNQFLKSGKRDLVIIARAWTEDAIKLCMENIERGMLKVYPLSAPYVDMQERFKDLVAITGAKFYDSESSDLSEMMITDVGFAKKVVARRYDALIAGNDNEEIAQKVETRVKELEKQLEGSESEFEKKNLRQRIGQLQGGFGIIKVGSYSDLDRKRLFDKCDDAVNAVRVAYQGGTVKGAGLAFKEISDSLPDTYLLKRPLLCIYEQIMSTAPNDFKIEDWVRDPFLIMKAILERGCDAAMALASAEGAIATEVPKGLNEIFQKQLAQAQSEQEN